MTISHIADVAVLQQHFADVFSPCLVVLHSQSTVEMCSGVAVQSCTYWLPEHVRQTYQKEVASMLEVGVIEPYSSWCCPIGLVVEINESLWLCVGYHKLSG